MFKCFFLNKKWLHWSLLGSLLILAVTWYQVHLDVQINEWFGEFYDLIQKALSEPNSVSYSEFGEQLLSIGKLVMPYIIIAVMTGYFTRHYVFRWRMAMNDYYTSHWEKLRHIEGASQRIQEDTMRFASIMEGLGVTFIRSLMTLVAFFPLLLELGKNVTEYPIIGELSYGLVYIAIITSLGATLLLAIVGIKLPGLEFNNQMVEAAYRKELVYGEDDESRAKPKKLTELFSDVRTNYFRLYFHYMYFDLFKYSYLQFNSLMPYIILAPTIISGVITLGVLQQIIRAFGKVQDSFHFFVNSWSTVVELLSIYKRLKGFEKNIHV